MFENIENISLIQATNKRRGNVTVNNRISHIMIYRTYGSGTYIFDDKTIESNEGSIIFIPKGYSYKFTPTINTACGSAWISFYADIINPEPVIFKRCNFPGLQNNFMNISKNINRHTPYSEYMCMSWFYSILAHLATEEKKTYSDKKKYSLIKPAIKYIDENLSDPNLNTDTLYSLCNISPAYFRRVFKANTGVTPSKYIEEKRLEYALSVIKEQRYPISKVSEMSGYTDPLYFGKVFKKKYGISPSYVKQFDEEIE